MPKLLSAQEGMYADAHINTKGYLSAWCILQQRLPNAALGQQTQVSQSRGQGFKPLFSCLTVLCFVWYATRSGLQNGWVLQA